MFQQFANIGVQFFRIVFESFGGLCELLRKILNRIALLTDKRILRPGGLSVAFILTLSGKNLRLRTHRRDNCEV